MSSNPPPPDDINAQIVTTTQGLVFQLTSREWQIRIIRDLVHSHRSNIKSKLIVRPTGRGKSMVYQVAGYLMKIITLFISPLFSLALDQI